MKTNLLKKSFILTGSISAAAIPISAAVSCSSLLGSNGAYDSDNDGKIIIQTTWSAGGLAIEALNKVVEKYNESQKETPGFMPVQVEHVEGGYGTIPSQVITKIQSHDTKTLPNLYIDYPSAVGQITPYKMNYDMGDVVKRNWFIDQFVNVNDKIAGIPSGKLYSAPLAKSTEALAIDKPLLKWIFNKLQTAGATIDSSGPIVQEIMNQNISSNDLTAIEGQWGNFIGTSTSANSLVINDNIFKAYNPLFNFINLTQKLFTTPGKPNLLGIDSPSNIIYSLSSLLTYNKEQNFLFSKNPSTGYVDFNFLKNGSNQTQTFNKSYEMIKNAINSNSVWIGGGGAYGSTRLQKHQMAISISSTAGLHYAYSSNRTREDLNKSETLFALPINRMDFYDSSHENIDVNGVTINLNDISSTISQGPSINNVHINASEDEASKKFLFWLYQASDSSSLIENHKPIDYFAQESSYIVPLKNALDNDSILGTQVSGQDYSSLNGAMIGVKASFETLKRQLQESEAHPNYAKFVELPVDDMTGSIRKIIDSNIAASYNSKTNGGSAYTEQQIWTNIHRQAIIDQIVDDDGTLSKKYKYPNMMNRNFSDINWTKYSYVDAEITGWTDGDTPKVRVLSTSNSDAVKSISTGDNLSIRISGIDTAEAHVKISELKYEALENSQRKIVGFTDAQMEKLINDYKAKNTPLAVYSNGHYNELSTNPNSKYTFWKNIYVDIQTTEEGNAYDPVLKDPAHPNSIYDFRKVKVQVGNGKEIPLITELAKKEGYWGLKAGDFGREQMPIGTKVRVATDGKKSYNRIVGSIFYGENLSKNWSVEIIKKGLTLPFLSNPSSVLDKTSILWQNGQAIADAFNYALDNRIGMFKIETNEKNLEEHLTKILSTHGMTDFQALIKYKGIKPINAPTTIYDYMEIREPDPSLTTTSRRRRK